MDMMGSVVGLLAIASAATLAVSLARRLARRASAALQEADDAANAITAAQPRDIMTTSDVPGYCSAPAGSSSQEHVTHHRIQEMHRADDLGLTATAARVRSMPHTRPGMPRPGTAPHARSPRDRRRVPQSGAAPRATSCYRAT